MNLPGLDMQARLDRVLLMGPRHAGVTLGARGYMWRDQFGGGSVPGFAKSKISALRVNDSR